MPAFKNAGQIGTGARLLTRESAAEYCSLSPQSFSAWVSIGRLPRSIPGTNRWDLKALDLALDMLSGLGHDEESALDSWRKARARGPEGNS